MKNSRLLSIIIPSTYAWFFLGVWILFYLKFTNYAGIGLIESIQIGGGFLFEIPTGSFADSIGKKRTIILGIFIMSIGNLIMALSLSFSYILVSVLFIALGRALLSGAWQALLYDSLKEDGVESTFENHVSKIERNNLLLMAFCSLVGGFLYTIDFRSPFYLTFVVGVLGLLLSFTLAEINIVTEKFSFKKYLTQTRRGFKNIFLNNKDLGVFLQILLISALFVILIEILDPALSLDKGLSEKGLGILYFIAPLVTAAGAHYYPQIKSAIKEKGIIYLIAISFALSIIITPYFGLGVIVLMTIYRNIFYSYTNIIASDRINKITESEERSTTLSTFAALASLPYVLVAFYLGKVIDEFGPSTFALYLGVGFIVLFVLISFVGSLKRNLAQ